MITVRFPNGQAVQYNTANFATRSQFGYTDLYTKEKGSWVAQVPNTCIVEVTIPCRVYNAVQENQLSTLVAKVEELSKEIRCLKRKIKC